MFEHEKMTCQRQVIHRNRRKKKPAAYLRLPVFANGFRI
jgi:hypothetical protein